MITDRMTDTEIHQEVKSEYPNLVSYMNKITPKYRRPIIKSNKFPMYFEPVEYLSPKGNKYIIFFEARRKKDHDGKMLFTIICVYNKDKGLNAMMFGDPSQRNIMIYSPHLFSRYRTRFLKDDSLSSMDVIKRFFKINPTLQGGETKENEIACTCNEGVLFGKFLDDGKITVLKTFISFDMLSETQKEYKEDLLENLLKYRAEIQ